jgi:predicted ArsR family transcriptional regulator
LVLLLRKHPGITVAELADELSISGMGVRRHLDALATLGLAERGACDGRHGVGRPPTGWRLTARGMELLPRRYDTFAIQLLDDLAEHVGNEAIAAALRRRTDMLVSQYAAELSGATTLEERVEVLVRIRDDAGYVAECHDDGGTMVLTENNCAVHKVAERFPAVCAMELALFREVLGPEVEVTRVAHTMAGDAVCAYRIRAKEGADREYAERDNAERDYDSP